MPNSWPDTKCEKKLEKLGCENKKFVNKCQITHRDNCGACPLKIVNKTNCMNDSTLYSQRGTGSCQKQCEKYLEFNEYFGDEALKNYYDHGKDGMCDKIANDTPEYNLEDWTRLKNAQEKRLASYKLGMMCLNKPLNS